MSMKIFFGAAALALGINACGKIDPAREQEHGVVSPPGFDRDSDAPPLALAGETVSLTFTGSLIVWDDQVTPAQIARIGDASRESREIKSGMAGYYGSELRTARQEHQQAEAAVEAVRQDKAEAIRKGYENSDLVRTVLTPIAEGWFEKRLSELLSRGSISPSDRDHARQMFQAYCEFKIWELAISPLASASYRSRPTPLAMCEPYYRDQQYFSDTALCGDAEGASGRDYFECIWRSGVLESRLFVSNLNEAACHVRARPNLYENRAMAIRSWLDAGILRRLLGDRDIPAGQVQSYGDVFRDVIVAGGPILSAVTTKEENGVQPYIDMNRCPLAFRRDFLEDMNAVSVEQWQLAVLQDLKTIGEVTLETISAARFKLLPSAGDFETDKLNWEKLAQYVLVFAARVGVSSDSPAASFSDVKFNPVVGVSLNASEAFMEKIRTDKAFAEFFNIDDRLVPETIRVREKDSAAALVAAEAELAAAEQRYKTDWQARLFSNQQASIAAVSDPGATRLFNAFLLSLSQNGSVLRVDLKFADATESIFGWIALTEGAVPTPPASPFASAGVAFDQETRRLTVSVPLHNPRALGFMSREATDVSPYFSRIDDSALAGTTLRMEFDLNRLDRRLDFFTGNTEVLDVSGSRLWQGSQSGDNLSQRLAELDAGAAQ